MFQRVDDEFGYDQPQADRDIGMHGAAVRGHRDRYPIMIVDHRCAEAFAKLGEITAQFNIAQARCRELLLEARRALPWVKVEKDYVFEGPDGPVTLGELFAGRSQRSEERTSELQ